ADVFRVRQTWARPTTTKQSKWLGMRVWRSATVKGEVRMSHMAARLYNPGGAENEKGASLAGGAFFEFAKDLVLAGRRTDGLLLAIVLVLEILEDARLGAAGRAGVVHSSLTHGGLFEVLPSSCYELRASLRR